MLVSTGMIEDNISELYTIQIQHKDMNKGQTFVVRNSSKFGNDGASLAKGGTCSAWTEHLDNWSLPGSKKDYRGCALTRNYSPSESFSGFQNCRFEPSTRPYIDV